MKDICRFQNYKWFTIYLFYLKLIQCLSLFEESKLNSFKHGWRNKHVVEKKRFGHKNWHYQNAPKK